MRLKSNWESTSEINKVGEELRKTPDIDLLPPHAYTHAHAYTCVHTKITLSFMVSTEITQPYGCSAKTIKTEYKWRQLLFSKTSETRKKKRSLRRYQ